MDGSQPFAVTQWQIWHVYSAFVRGVIDDLYDAAKQLVANGIAEVAMVSNGVSYWRAADGSIHEDEIELEVRDHRNHGSIWFPEGAEGFSLEGLYTGAMMRFGELRIFGEESPVPYLRAVLGECHLTVVCQDVVPIQATDRRIVVESRVCSVVVVEVKVRRQPALSLG